MRVPDFPNGGPGSRIGEGPASDRRVAAGGRLSARVVAAVLLASVTAWVLASPLLSAVEWATVDARMRLRNAIAPQPLRDDIVLVGITDFDLDALGEEIASREIHELLLARLRDAGAASVVYDVLFETEGALDDVLALRMAEVPTVLAFKVEPEIAFTPPPGEPPESLAPLGERIDAAGADELAELLTGALADYRRRLLDEREIRRFAADSEEGRGALEELQRLVDWTRWYQRRAATRWIEVAWGKPHDGGGEPMRAASLLPLSPALLTASAAVGTASIDKSRESIVRRVPLVYLSGDRLVPNLDLAAICQYHGVTMRDVEIEWGREIRIRPERNADGILRIPIDRAGRYLINWREGESFLARPTNPTLRLATLPGLEAARAQAGLDARLSGAIVLVGELVSGGRSTDVEPVPLQPAFPMVGMHANVIDNILRRDFVRLAGAGALAGAVLLACVAAGLSFARLPTNGAMAINTIIFLGWIGLSLADFVQRGVIWPVAAPAGAWMTWTAGLLVLATGAANRERRRVREAFARTVSPRIGEEILARLDDPALWGTRRELTAVFVDIRGYTAMTETSDPAELLRTLDGFYAAACEEVFAREGQVNKFLGDAVLAIFGAMPEETPDHARRGVEAALAIQGRMAALGLATGAGVASGPAVAGLVGDRRVRVEFTAIGDPVNLASRLQGLAATNDVIVSADCWQALREDARRDLESRHGAERLENLPIKGKAEPQTAIRLVPAGNNPEGKWKS
jgi:adenylate cyclase